MTETFYKITNPDGTSFQDGKTKYEVGKTVRKRKCMAPKLCTNTVLHASPTIKDALWYATSLPMAIWKVEGDPVVHGDKKAGFFSLRVVEKIEPTDELLGFRYREACNPINPMAIQNEISDVDIAALKAWVLVWSSVRDSVWSSVRDSVRDSVWGSVWSSVRDSAGAYIGSLFLNIKKWFYIKHEEGVYPFQSAVDLWRRGFVPVKIGGNWHLYGWRDGRAVSLYEGEEF